MLFFIKKFSGCGFKHAYNCVCCQKQLGYQGPFGFSVTGWINFDNFCNNGFGTIEIYYQFQRLESKICAHMHTKR